MIFFRKDTLLNVEYESINTQCSSTHQVTEMTNAVMKLKIKIHKITKISVFTQWRNAKTRDPHVGPPQDSHMGP